MKVYPFRVSRQRKALTKPLKRHFEYKIATIIANRAEDSVEATQRAVEALSKFRKDHPDAVFLNKAGKFRAVVNEIKDANAKGQPVLVGTTSIEVSEMLSAQLKAAGIPHEVLNAKQHEREAHIVAQAGRPGAVTIATNMAGRGTDIVLGGSLEAEVQAREAENGGELDEVARQRIKAEWQQRHDQVKASGGLHIIGTERHESRRSRRERGRAP